MPLPQGAKTSVDVNGLPKPPFRYSHLIRAGDFLFPAGVIASDFQGGVAGEARVDPRRPHHTRRTVPQTKWIFDRLQRILAAGGSSLDNVVRIDQFFARRDDKPGYLATKNQILRGDRPASAALEMSGLIIPDAAVLVDTVAIVPSPSFAKRGISTEKAPKIRAGHPMAVRAGDWIFTSGATPSDLVVDAPYPWGTDGTAGLAAEARANYNFNYDYPMPKQLHYVFKKMDAYLTAAGSDLNHVVKAQAYLTDMTDFYDFAEIWSEYFPSKPPATLVAPLTRTGMTGGRLEVSLVALAAASNLPVEHISVPSAGGTLGPFPDAVRAGNLLLLSGQNAATAEGYHAAARVDAAQPHFASGAKLEMHVIVERVRTICEAAGGSIDSVVKAVFFFADLNDVYPMMEVWGQAFGDHPPAISIVHSTAAQILPECRVTADVYAAL